MRKVTINPVIVKILLFSIIFLILYRFAGEVLSPKWKYPVDSEDHIGRMEEYASLRTDPEVIFMGTSHVLYGVTPMQIYEETGIPTYNLAISGFHIGIGYSLLQEAMRFHKPKILALDASTLYREFKDGEGSYARAIDMVGSEKARFDLSQIYASCYVDKKKEDEKKFNERIEKGLEDFPKEKADTDWSAMRRKAFLFAFSRMYGHHSRWMELNKYDFELKWPNAYMAKGYVFATNIRAGGYSEEEMNRIADDMAEIRTVSEDVYKYGNKKSEFDEIKWYDPEVPEENKVFFRQLKGLCDDNDIRLVIFKVPVIASPAEYHSAWTEKRHEAIEHFASQEGVAFFDILYDSKEVFDIKRDFIDGGKHCNYLGAEKTSKLLGNYLKNEFNLQPEKSPEFDNDMTTYLDIAEVMKLQTLSDYTEYMELLAKIGRGRNIYFASSGKGTNIFSSEDAKLLEKIGFSNHPDGSETARAYIGVISDGKASIEKLSDKTAEYYCNLNDDIKINILSRGERPVDEGIPVSSILVNGVNYSLNREGLNFVVYDCETKCIIDSVAIVNGEEGRLSIVHRDGNDLIGAYKRARYNIAGGLPL